MLRVSQGLLNGNENEKARRFHVRSDVNFARSIQQCGNLLSGEKGRKEVTEWLSQLRHVCFTICKKTTLVAGQK